MSAIKSQHSRTFERLIEKQRQVLIDSLIASGQLQHDNIVGRITGLDDALRISEQADYEISGDEPSASP